MKTKPAWIGMLSLSLIVAACDKKEEVTQKAKPEAPRTRPFGANQRTPHLKPVAPEPRAADETEITQAPANEAGITQTPADVTEDTTMPPPAQDAPAGTKTTAELQAERKARMAKANEERAAQATIQLAARFKEQDTNGDGYLAKDEVTGPMQRGFAQADKNGDGFLDATEQAEMIQTSAGRMNDGGGQRRGGGPGGGGGPGRGPGRGNGNP